MPPSDTQATTCRLRILATSDLHAHLAPYDYYSDTPSDRVGLVRTAALIRDWRQGADNTVLLDNGDLIQGTPLGDYAANHPATTPHPMIDAMNALEYDAATFGNHEFNYGLPFLQDVVAQASFPFTCANVVSLTDSPLTDPFVILDRQVIDDAGHSHPLRIGIVGFAPPQIMTWDRGHLVGRIDALDIVETAQRIVPQIQEAGADIVIALCHSGITDHPHERGMENASAHLAKVEGIDAIITGHSHLTFPAPQFAETNGADIAQGTLSGVPAVMPGLWGSHLGVIDLTLEKTAGEWRRIAHDVNLPIIYNRDQNGDIHATVPDAPEIAKITERAHQVTLTYVRHGVGQTTAALHSYFALVRPDTSVQVVAEAQRAHLQTVLQETEHHSLPILSAASPFKAGGRGGSTYYTDIPEGPIATKDIASLYLYPNLFYGVQAMGHEVFEWLERAASMFHQIESGANDMPLIDPAFPTYNFDTLLGLTYDIDITTPPRFNPLGALINLKSQRIKNVRYNGTLVTRDMRFAVATNNYRAVGGGNFPLSLGQPPLYVGAEACRDVVAAHVTQSAAYTPHTSPTWRLIGGTDATATFDTGLGALKYLGDAENDRISDTGHRENGFARLRLTL